MEGGVIQARAHRSIIPFDASVRQLREYLNLLVASPPSASPSTR
jgi:TetR/AcrR family transcriptional regulator, transcriptional repressor for nem operon